MPITFSACRDMLPDPEFYADCVQSAFDELSRVARKPKASASRKVATKKAARKKSAHKRSAAPRRTKPYGTGQTGD